MLVHKFSIPPENQLHPFINAVECYVSTTLHFHRAHRTQKHKPDSFRVSYNIRRQIGVKLIVCSAHLQTKTRTKKKFYKIEFA